MRLRPLAAALAVLLAAATGAQEARTAPGAGADAKAVDGAPIFNGRDLTGWQHVGPGGFVVEDGQLKTEGGMGLLWYTREKLGDAVVRVVYRNVGGGNSGVFIRIPEEPEEPWMPVNRGYEVQIDDRGDDQHSTGVLYSLTRAAARAGRPGEWNTMEITLDGDRTVVHVNGTLVTDYREGQPVPPKVKDYEPDRGPRPRQGYIGLQNHGKEDVVYFREVSVRPIAKKAGLAAARPYQPPFGPWTRANGGAPVLEPQRSGIEAAGVFNPAVIEHEGRYVMLYRAQDAGKTSRLALATSGDGIQFTREGDPVLVPEAEYERGGGVEDPRLVAIGGTFYLTYTAYDGKDAQLALATSTDLRRWQRRGVIMPANRGRWNVHWTKAGAILDQRVGGKWWMYYMGDAKGAYDQTGVAWSEDLLTWTEALDAPVLPHRKGMFDSRVVEPGPPPLLTEDGILLVYNGADQKLVYRTGWALFDRQDPTRLLARSDRPIFEPEQWWEKAGQVPNVVFVEGLVRQGPRWLFYYGGADTRVGVAEAFTRDGAR